MCRKAQISPDSSMFSALQTIAFSFMPSLHVVEHHLKSALSKLSMPSQMDRFGLMTSLEMTRNISPT